MYVATCTFIYMYLDLVDWDHQHPLKHFGEISEVEGIVRLCWCGEQFSSDGVIHGRGGAYQLRNLMEENDTQLLRTLLL